MQLPGNIDEIYTKHWDGVGWGVQQAITLLAMRICYGTTPKRSWFDGSRMLTVETMAFLSNRPPALGVLR